MKPIKPIAAALMVMPLMMFMGCGSDKPIIDSLTPDTGACVSKTCEELGAGYVGDDGCGVEVSCEAACVSKTCEELGAGYVGDDGCGVEVSCVKPKDITLNLAMKFGKLLKIKKKISRL